MQNEDRTSGLGVGTVPALPAILFFLAFVSLVAIFLYSARYKYHIRRKIENFIEAVPLGQSQDILKLRGAVNAATPGVGDTVVRAWLVRYRRLWRHIRIIVDFASTIPIIFALAGYLLLRRDTDSLLPSTLAEWAGLALFLVVDILTLLAIRRLIRLLVGLSVKFRAAAWCEELLKRCMDEASGEALFFMQHLAWLELALQRQVFFTVESISDIADEARVHLSAVCAVLKNFSLRIAREEPADDIKKELAKNCANISVAALSDRICGYLDEETLKLVSDSTVLEGASPLRPKIVEIFAVAMTFLVLISAAVGVYVLSGSDILASAALALGSVLFIGMLPRGEERLSWLTKILPGR